METVHDGTPLAAYLEGAGSLDADIDHTGVHLTNANEAVVDDQPEVPTFAPPYLVNGKIHTQRSWPPPLTIRPKSHSSLGRLYNTWSTAVNSRLGRADNARFIEHFRYVIVASSLLNEFLDHGSLQQPGISAHAFDGSPTESNISSSATNLYGAAATAVFAFALVYFLHWARSSRDGTVSKSRMTLVIAVLSVVAAVIYIFLRRQWLRSLRRHAVTSASSLTANWQAFEVSCSSALSVIQEVELVSRGYRLSMPLPPASRIEDQGVSRRCGRLRKVLCKAYSSAIPACIDACAALKTLIDEDDLEKYFEVYDVNAEDTNEAAGADALRVLEDDVESLKSLRILSYRAGVLRRVTLCSLMALEADGGKPDFQRWRVVTEIMDRLDIAVAHSGEKTRQVLSEMETLSIPQRPAKSSHTPVKEKMRSQVRKISMLSSGIRGLQAKMQILREETNRSIEQQEDLADLGPSLMAQYDSIGADLKELMQAWEAGKTSLQGNITKQEKRISMASSSVRSPVSSQGGSLSGLTAVDEGGSPADALNALNGLTPVTGTFSNRSSSATSPSDEEVFEGISLPRQRSMLTRDERIVKMQEERERQATMRAKRESNTHMLRELESVINLRPKRTSTARITSI